MNPLFDSIADGLADHGYAIADQFLSQVEVDAILTTENFESNLSRFKQAGIGKQSDLMINEAIRGDYIQWLDKRNAPPAINIYLRKLEELVGFLNESLFLSLKDFEVHQTIYPTGTFYKRHIDQFKHDDHRKLSVIFYLNQNWTEDYGGQLRIYLKEGAKDILPTAGRLVCFRSDQIEHEVLPATRPRLSLTGWILDQYSDLRHL